MLNMAFREAHSWEEAELNGGFLCKVTTKRDQELLGIVRIHESAESGVLKIPINAIDRTLGEVLVEHNVKEIAELRGDLSVAFGLMGLKFNHTYRDSLYNTFTGSSSRGYSDREGIILSVIINGYVEVLSDRKWHVESYSKCLLEAMGMLGITPMHVQS